MAHIPQAKPALIFIPDISGFTTFVTNTEIVHSQHIITELLETMMATNQTNLEVSEIEGDAILYYRFGKATTAQEMLDQVQEMFVKFHEHLLRYENRRICQCGACKSAHNLTLKFVVHYGDIALNKVGTHEKLFGKEVIVAHRLLKNEIPHHEYALFTTPLQHACDTWTKADDIAWTNFEQGKEVYDSGPVAFNYLALAPLKDKVKPVEKLPPIMPGQPVKMLEFKYPFQAPSNYVMSKLIDLSFRPEWSGIGINMISPHEMNREGTVHQCIIPDSKNQPEFVTENFQFNGSKSSFDETDLKGRFSTRWIVEKTGPEEAQVTSQIWVKNNFFVKTFFRLFAKKKIEKSAAEGMVKLDALLKEEFQKKGAWEADLVLEEIA